MSTWNYRLLAHEQNDDIILCVHEVYYDEKGNPDGYTEGEARVAGETIKEAKWCLKKIKECLSKPILYAGVKFPKEYKEEK